jgi:hypothetical protein
MADADAACRKMYTDPELKPPLDIFSWEQGNQSAGTIGKCWRQVSQRMDVDFTDKLDGTYEVQWGVDVPKFVSYNPPLYYMGTYMIDIQIKTATGEKKANGDDVKEWIHVPNSPLSAEMIAIDCGQGAEQNNKGDACWCVAGWQTTKTSTATNFKCERCPAGKFKELWMVNQELPCTPCPAREDTNGTVGATYKHQCVCQPGYYDPRKPYTHINSSLIRRQKQYAFGSQGITARDPPKVFTAQERKLIKEGKLRPNSELEILWCYEHSFVDYAWDEVFPGEDYLKFRCQRCPDKHICDPDDPLSCDAKGDCASCWGNETIGVKWGWWAAERKVPAAFVEWGPVTTEGREIVRTSRKIFSCPEADKSMACEGGENVQKCKEGHENTACASCAPNYAMADMKCDSCGEEKVGEKIGAMLFGAILAAIGFYIAVKFVTPEIAVKVKILIAMGQVLGGFKDTYQIKWPAFMKALLEEFKIFNFDLFSFGNMGCQIPEIKNFYYKFALTVLTPAFLIGVVVAVFILRMIVLKGKRLADKEAHARLVHILEDLNFRGACFSKGFFVLILLYLKTSATILMMFNCREFENECPEDMPNCDPPTQGLAVEVLAVDYNRDCTDEEYTLLMFNVGLIFVGIYPLGVPALFALLMFKNRKNINDSINIQKYGFIFKDYGPVFFFWEIWDLVRKLTMSGLLIFFDKGSADQLSLAILFSTLALVFHTRMFPYSDMSANWIQLSVLASLQLTLFGSLVLKMDSGDESLSSTAVDIYLTSVNILIPTMLCSIVAFEAQRAFTAKARAKLKLAKRRKRQQQLLAESQGVDLTEISKRIEEEERLSAEAKAARVGLHRKMAGGLAKSTGMSMMGVASMAAAKGVAHRVNVFASRVTSAKDLFPTLADEKLAVKKLQFDKERAEEAFIQADREATDLSEWINFARSNSASENELMSFVKAFGDELLGDVDVHDMDFGELEIHEAGGKRGKRSAAVVLADNYPFIRSAAMALRRHHFG